MYEVRPDGYDDRTKKRTVVRDVGVKTPVGLLPPSPGSLEALAWLIVGPAGAETSLLDVSCFPRPSGENISLACVRACVRATESSETRGRVIFIFIVTSL